MKIKKAIVTSYKKATYTHHQVPSNLIERMLFGAPFLDYCAYRFSRTADAMLKDGNPIFDAIRVLENGQMRIKHGQPVGEFTKKFIKLHNSKFSEKFKKINLKKEKSINFRLVLKDNAARWKRRAKRKRQEELERCEQRKRPRVSPTERILQLPSSVQPRVPSTPAIRSPPSVPPTLLLPVPPSVRPSTPANDSTPKKSTTATVQSLRERLGKIKAREEKRKERTAQRQIGTAYRQAHVHRVHNGMETRYRRRARLLESGVDEEQLVESRQQAAADVGRGQVS